jgi:serine/threonine-protein kinase ATR
MQEEINEIMSQASMTVPAQSFYTAMPQLISRVNHRNSETALVVHGILSRVLMEFPGQALWTLTWLRNSANKDRAKIGDNIFKHAQDGLLEKKQKKCQEMLLASKQLVKFFIDLAKYVIFCMVGMLVGLFLVSRNIDYCFQAEAK